MAERSTFGVSVSNLSIGSPWRGAGSLTLFWVVRNIGRSAAGTIGGIDDTITATRVRAVMSTRRGAALSGNVGQGSWAVVRSWSWAGRPAGKSQAAVWQ